MTSKELQTGLPELYHTHYIPKISGNKVVGWRLIEEPIEELKVIQRQLIPWLEQFPLHSAVYGIKGKSAVSNAAVHQGANIVIRLDIHKFFQSTTRDIIHRSLRYAAHINSVSKRITDYIYNTCDTCLIYSDLGMMSDRLPTGAPTSPILANIAFSRYDYILDCLAKEYELMYTRYVDDLTFSGRYRPAGFVTRVKEIISPYQINWKKIDSSHKSYQRQQVTGVVINEKVSVPRQMRKIIRVKLDHLARGGKEIDEVTCGELSYIRSVNQGQYQTLLRHYDKRIQFYQEQQQ